MTTVRLASSIAFALLGTGCGDPSAQDSVFATMSQSSGDSETGAPDEESDSGESEDGESDGESAEDEGSEHQFDVEPDDPEVDCPCGSDLGFSYIWVANSVESTVSKLNTQTLDEEGRYRTHPTTQGNPSRTSVSLSGRAVAVANRHGGVVKVRSQSQDCDPMRNGNPGLQTSQGPDDVLEWAQDDCVDWFVDFEVTSQRPIAWVGGQHDPVDCEPVGEKVWTSGCNKFADQWIWVHRIDGDTGEVEVSMEVPGFACYGFGGYGGAADGDGNFWVSDHNTDGHLARIDAETLESQVWSTPAIPYGITVDSAGRPWITCNGGAECSAARFDPETETWALADDHITSGQSGIQQDATGRMWLNYWGYDGDYSYGVVAIDAETLAVGDPIVTGTGAKGISVDLDGYLWSIAPQTNSAYRIDPETKLIESYAGLDHPYTYSDMTGWGLQNATCQPEG